MEQRNEAQRLGIGKGRDEDAQKFAQGKGVVRISHNALFTRANAKLVALSTGHNFFVSNPNHTPFEALDF